MRSFYLLIWDQWKLDEAVDYGATGGPLPTHAIARILTINRCTEPCSNYSVPMWAEKTALAEVLDIDLCGLEEDEAISPSGKYFAKKLEIPFYQISPRHAGVEAFPDNCFKIPAPNFLLSAG